MDPAIAQLPRRQFTIEEVEQMVELGILREDEPVELIEGELVVVTPQGPAHSSVKDRLHHLLDRAYGDRGWVRNQSPTVAAPSSLPEPDLAVAAGTWEDYYDRHPRCDELLLAVEVAVTSQQVDHAKASVYARAGVPVLWIVDVPARRVEVHTGPSPEGVYLVTTVFLHHDSLPLPGLDGPLAIREFLR